MEPTPPHDASHHDSQARHAEPQQWWSVDAAARAELEHLELDGRLLAHVRIDPAQAGPPRIHTLGAPAALVASELGDGHLRLAPVRATGGLPVRVEVRVARVPVLGIHGSVTADIELCPDAATRLIVDGHARAAVSGAATGWHVSVGGDAQALLWPAVEARISLHLRGRSVTHMMGATEVLRVSASDRAVLQAKSPGFQTQTANVEIDGHAKLQLSVTEGVRGNVLDPAELILADPSVDPDMRSLREMR